MGGATEIMRASFLTGHLKENLCQEWRFQGHFGFGGKYRSLTNKVDCYREDETPERLKRIKEINFKLAKSDEIQN